MNLPFFTFDFLSDKMLSETILRRILYKWQELNNLWMEIPPQLM